MPHMGCGAAHFLIGCIDYYASVSCREKVIHVCLKCTILDEMINYIQRYRQLLKQARMIYKTRAVVKEEALGWVIRELRLQSPMAARETSRPTYRG